MKDRNIDIKGKAIYALLCTYAGSSRTAFPGVKLILADLGISKDTYYKHMGQLRAYGYVRVRQENSGGGQFMSNVYTLSPCPNSPDAAKPDTENPDAANQDTKNNNIQKVKELKSNKRAQKEIPLFATQLSMRLFNWIKKNYPDRKHEEKHTAKWAEDIEKLSRIDGYSKEKIAEVIDWSQKNHFWHKNIKSGDTLRRQFEKLLDAIADEKKTAPNGQPFKPYVPIGGVAKNLPPREDRRAPMDSEGRKKFEEMRKRLMKTQQLP